MYRIVKLQKIIGQKKLSAMLIQQPHNVRYLCGYVGSNGRLLVTRQKATFVTDFRYIRQARRQIPKAVKIFDQKKGKCRLPVRSKILGFEEEHMTCAQLKSLKKSLRGVRLQPTSGLVENLRMVKEPEEIMIIRKAVKIADECMKRFVKKFRVGMSEIEAEWELLKIVRQLGADGFSFPPIIAFGKNSADVHHKVCSRKLKHGDMILVDMGISYKGYMTDMTRTFFTRGGVSSRAKSRDEQKIYSTVLAANQAAIKAIEVGKKFSDIDKAARSVIRKAGYGKYFGHSTGHGVGLEIHEAPSVSEKSDDAVQPGMVFTIEPGIYLDRVGGVRIEDMVYVNQRGKAEILTKYPKKLSILSI